MIIFTLYLCIALGIYICRNEMDSQIARGSVYGCCYWALGWGWRLFV